MRRQALVPIFQHLRDRRVADCRLLDVAAGTGRFLTFVKDNLAADPRASLLVEHWDAGDWSRLWWVRADLEHVAEPPPAAIASGALFAGAGLRLRSATLAFMSKLMVFERA